MTYYPGPALTTETLAKARSRYTGLLASVSESKSFDAAWRAHRPTLARLEEAEATYALPFLARLQLTNPANWALIDDREAAYPKAEMMEALSSLLDDFEAEYGDASYFLPIIRGVSRYIDGISEEAFDEFAKLADENAFYDVVKDDFSGAACARRLISMRGARAFRGQAEFPDIHMRHQSDRVERSLLSISADGIYFRAFVPTWKPVLRALRQHGIGGHFHLMARGEEELRLLDDLVRWAKAEDVSCVVTFEIVQPIDRAYFTIRRFFAAQTVMARTGASLVVLDADLAVQEPGHIPSVFARDEGVSVAFSSGPWHGYLPWRRMSGGVVVLPACDSTRRYLELVTDYIEYFWLANSTRHWWVDQLALECARLTAVKQWPSMIFRDLGPAIWDMFVASEDYKVEQLNRLPEISGATNQGQHWGAALEQLQLSE